MILSSDCLSTDTSSGCRCETCKSTSATLPASEMNEHCRYSTYKHRTPQAKNRAIIRIRQTKTIFARVPGWCQGGLALCVTWDRRRRGPGCVESRAEMGSPFSRRLVKNTTPLSGPFSFPDLESKRTLQLAKRCSQPGYLTSLEDQLITHSRELNGPPPLCTTL